MAASDSEGEMDLTSKLPDELLVKFLSQGFTLKEAARTSVISSRWRNLWKSAEDLDLDFDGSKKLSVISDSSSKEDLLATERKWFINWVNGVVGELQNRPQKIRRFRVLFDLSNNCNSEGDIDRWLEFAISKKVESLHIVFRWTRRLYKFSEDCYNRIKTPAGSSQIKSLRSLRLSAVEVRNGILEHFLATCPLLEELAVELSEYFLTKLKVVGHSQLKHLEIRNCVELESMEIDNMPRLTRMVYVHRFCVGDIRVRNCPCLVDLTLGCSKPAFRHMSGLFSTWAGQLESLLLRIDPDGLPVRDFAEHTRLKRLTFQVTNYGGYNIRGLISLINACPCLHTLQFFMRTTKDSAPSLPSFLDRNENKLVKTRRHSVKVVKIVGFRGFEMERKLVEYAMEYFDRLETVVLDRALGGPYFCDGSVNGDLENPCSEEQASAALKLALAFKSKAPSSVDFVVI